MLKALAIKELRESLGIVALAVLGLAWVVACNMGKNPLLGFVSFSYSDHHIAFLSDSFNEMSLWIIGGLAVALGLKQSAWEVHHNTFYYLFHRPISRRLVMGIKLMVGVFLVFGLFAAAILIYGLWAGVPGHLPAPFEWSMTIDAWILAFSMPLLYLGGFLSGIRPGRWLGTRLLPLVATLMWLTALTSIFEFWWVRLPLLVVGTLGLLVAIDYYTET